MRKKITFCLLLILCCMLLSGCVFQDIKDACESIMTGAQTSALKDNVAKDNAYAMSASTKEQQEKALAAQDKADDLATRCANESHLWPPSNWFLESRSNRAASKASKAINAYETAKATDDVFIQSRKAEGLFGANTTFQWSRFGWILGLVVILAIIVIFKILSNKKREAKAMKKAAKKGNITVVQQSPAPAPVEPIAIPADQQAVLVDRNDEKAAKSCKKYCEKYGIDYDTYLAQYNGDNKALLDFLISSSAEDFQ